MLNFIAHGLIPLPWWAYVLIAAGSMHVTITAVTLYFHRDQAHRAIDLHPALRQFFRFWVWLTTAMITHQWVAVHRKHHAFTEQPGDPHSPQIYGLKRLLLDGVGLYRQSARDPDVVAHYSHGTPNDWLEKNLYTRLDILGVSALFLLEITLFGAPGLVIWALQMLCMPVMAAGVVNGLGHHSGYRNFECRDASTNIVPIGALLGGEELHNNHHAFPSSARFSMRRFEFDLGWLYIRMLCKLRLARVRRIAPHPVLSPRPSRHLDLETLRAVLTNRLHVLRAYRRNVLYPMIRQELGRKGWKVGRVKQLFVREERLLDARSRKRRLEALASSQRLATVYEFRERLRAIWEERATSNERLLTRLGDWCAAAEASGIRALADFSEQLKSYRLSATV